MLGYNPNISVSVFIEGKMIEDRRNWMAKDLAEAVSLDPSRIRQLLLAGKIHGEKVGQVWVKILTLV